MPEVFISYSKTDEVRAMALSVHLESGPSVTTWLMATDIRPGERWPDAIARGLAGSQAMLVLVSATDSAWIQDEVRIARDRGIPIIPVKIAAAALTPGSDVLLGSYQWIDAWDGAFESHFARIDDAARRTLGLAPRARGVPLPAPIPPADRVRRSRRLLLTLIAAAVLAVIGVAWALVDGMRRDAPGVVVERPKRPRDPTFPPSDIQRPVQATGIDVECETPDCEVVLDRESREPQRRTTGQGKRCSFENVAPGRHTVVALKTGFRVPEPVVCDVASGKRTSVSLPALRAMIGGSAIRAK